MTLLDNLISWPLLNIENTTIIRNIIILYKYKDKKIIQENKNCL
jgi:hypothetical protein